MKTFTLLLTLFTSLVSVEQVRPVVNSQTISASGSTISIPNENGLVAGSFEVKVSGAPSTVNVVIKGCAAGGTCDTIDTYTTVADSIRKPTIAGPYTKFTATASWTGGSSPSVKVNSMLGRLPSAGLYIYVDATTGNDSNSGSWGQPVLTLEKARSLAANHPKAVISGCGTFPELLTLTSVDTGVTWKKAGYCQTDFLISGGAILPHSFTNTGGITCSGNCSEWQYSSASGTYGKYGALWYLKSGQTEWERRFRPTLFSETNGYSTQGANNGPAFICVGTQSVSAPAQGNCSAGQFERLDAVRRDATVGHADTQTAFHGLSGSATIGGAITGIHDPEIVLFEGGWTAARMPLTPTGGDATNACTLSAVRLCWTGVTTAGSVFGPQNSQRYLIDNVFEQLGLGTNGPGQWYQDRDSNSDGTLDANNVLDYLAKTGENPNIDTIVVPQRTQLLVGTSVQDVTFNGVTLSFDKYDLPASGQPAVSHASNLAAAVSFTTSSNITFINSRFIHMSNWALECVGAPATGKSGCTVKDSIFADLGTGGIRYGVIANGGDTETNVSQNNTVENVVLRGGQRFMPGGIGLAIWVGNSHNNSIQHVWIDDWYSGAIGIGATLGNPSNQGPALAHDNVLRYIHCSNIGEGVTDDEGCLHAATSNQTGNELSNFYFHDCTQNTMAFGHTCVGVYLDNGASNWLVRDGLILRVSDAAIFMNNPPGMVNNTFDNLILAYPRKGCIRKNFDETVKVFDMRNTICYFDKGNAAGGVQEDTNRSNWQPKPGGTILDIFTLDFNSYYNPVTPLLTNARAFYTTDGTNSFVPSCNGVGGGCTPAQWQALGQDVHSLFDVNPGFVAPSYPSDNYNFISAVPLSFIPIDYPKIGPSGALPSIPATVAAGFPLQLLDPAVDF